MKYLKLFEGFQSEEEIAEICDKRGIKNWSINSEGLVDVDGDVYFFRGLKKLPFRFGTVTGSFRVTNNHELESLEGCPHTVGGNFDCSTNKIKSLKGSPKTVGGDFDCKYNKLKSLENGPETVGGDFECDYNQLTNLVGAPKTVGGNFWCNNNQIKSFEGVPKFTGNFHCDYNPISRIWHIINEYSDWNEEIMDLFNDYDCLRDDDIIIDRFNEFLRQIEKPEVDFVDGYNNI